jgi:hypothetical protein
LMVEPTVSCPLCGTRFDPDEGQACSSCPLGSGCRLTCCPKCHYSWVEPGRMAAAGWISRVLRSEPPRVSSND